MALYSVSRERKVCTTLYNGHYLKLHVAYVQPLLHFVENNYHVMDVSQLMIAFFIISLFAASHIVRNCLLVHRLQVSREDFGLCLDYLCSSRPL